MAPPLSLDAQLRTLSAELTGEIEQLKVELREIDVLVRQTGGEIERLVHKQQDASMHLRQVESNFDLYSREDIKQAYAAERDTQLKQGIMRAQLEQFQSKQRYLDRYIQQLHRTSDMSLRAAEQISAAAANVSPERLPGPDHDSVVQTVEAQEAERQLLAQQMHDGPAQSLTNLILQAEIVERLFTNNPERARAELIALKASANTTFQRVREFIFGLRPMMLDDLGLIPTLKRYVQNLEAKSKLPISLSLNGDRTLPSYVEVTIFRSVQELLTNVMRHAGATKAQVSVDLQSEPVTVCVEDDGSGFDPEQVTARGRGRASSGLGMLEKRLEMLGGKISYESGSGKGARICVEIPPS